MPANSSSTCERLRDTMRPEKSDLLILRRCNVAPPCTPRSSRAHAASPSAAHRCRPQAPAMFSRGPEPRCHERFSTLISYNPHQGRQCRAPCQGSWVMTILKYVGTVGAAALLTTAVALPAAAQSANAVLHDKNGKDVGTVNLLQTPAGVL